MLCCVLERAGQICQDGSKFTIKRTIDQIDYIYTAIAAIYMRFPGRDGGVEVCVGFPYHNPFV